MKGYMLSKFEENFKEFYFLFFAAIAFFLANILYFDDNMSVIPPNIFYSLAC